MMVVLHSASNAFLTPNPILSADKYLHSAANLLCLNRIMSPAIELRDGELSIETDTPLLAAVTGDAEVSTDGHRASAWMAVHFTRSLDVRARGTAYVALKGLQSEAGSRIPLFSGFSLSLDAAELNGVHPRILAALKIPPSLRGDDGDWLQAASRLQKYLIFLSDIVQRGAELVRVKLGGVEYEAWVLELQ